MGFICSIGFYPLFYKLNKPASRWRSIALLAVVILGFPLYLLLNDLYFYGKVEAPSLFDLTVLYCAIFLLSCVLLGNNRFRSLIAASFLFSIINLAQFPIVCFSAVFIYPVSDLLIYMEATSTYPQLYYGAIFFINIVITFSCLLAARWLRNTMLKPPLKLYVLFNLLFVVFTLIVLIWLEDLMILPLSLPVSTFMGTLFLVILFFLFFLYTRLTTDNLNSGIKGTENSLSLSTSNADKYTPFIQHLSRRELEVVEAILAGNVSYKQLSNTLNISVNTVKTHLKHIYQTTGVSNIAGLSSLFYGYTSNHP